MAVYELIDEYGALTGTAGDDQFNLKLGGAFYTIDGGAGIDTVSFGQAHYNKYVILAPDSTGMVEVDSVTGASWVYVVQLKNVEFVTWDGGVTVVNLAAWFNHIDGTEGNDTLMGTALPEYINGFGGNDVISGGGGNDIINGGTGNDIIAGGTGNDIIDGGAGINTAVSSGPRANYSFDLIESSTVADNVGTDGTDTLSKIQILKFSDLNVYYAFTGTLEAAVGGKDIVHVTNVSLLNATVTAPWTAGGESYNDSFSSSGSYASISTPGLAVDLSAITAGKGYSLTNTGAGTVLKGSGLDDSITLTAGDGNWGTGYAARNDGSPGVAGSGQQFALDGKHRFAGVTDGSGGTDTLQLPNGGNAFFLHDAYSLFSSGVVLANDARGMPSTARVAGIEVIKAGSGGDLIDLTSPNYSIGGVSLVGGAGNDILWGNAGDDTISGGDGNDILFGGAGHNTLSGGAGADSFQYVKNGNAHDTIQDFTPGTDIIQLFGAASVAEVAVALAGGHVLLSWGEQTIELTGITSTTGATGWFQLG